ncbi:hypothetical protein UPYG_G00022360 [Umbra pygmaea]|uniref:G-protein coupled receptors family 1 profile domain-containing protein n=1 Tax=Umbra pygmaea TaxID=75934 RepID=A0ABD0Y538_UMBPY
MSESFLFTILKMEIKMAEHNIYEDDYNDSYDFNTTFVPNPNSLPCALQNLNPFADIALCVLLIIIFLLAVPGNVLVGLVIGSSRQALTSSDIYLFHLSIADVMLALTLPIWAAAVVHGWIFGSFMCKILSLVLEVNFYTSILFLVCISVDRYLAIVRSAVFRKTRRMVFSWAICGGVWALGGALSLPALLNITFTHRNKTICTDPFETELLLTTRGLRHILGFLLPLIIMVTCSCVTMMQLLQTQGLRKHRAMRVIIAVVIAFLLCWMPYHLTMMVDTLDTAKVVTFNCAERSRVNLALQVTKNLALLHSCVNPVLYAFVGEKFRRNLGVLIRKRLEPEKSSAPRYSRSTSQTSEVNRLL